VYLATIIYWLEAMATKETSLSCFKIIQQWKKQRIAELDDVEYIEVGFIFGCLVLQS